MSAEAYAEAVARATLTAGCSCLELDAEAVREAIALGGAGGTLYLSPRQASDIGGGDTFDGTPIVVVDAKRINAGADWLGVYSGPGRAVGICSRASAGTFGRRVHQAPSLSGCDHLEFRAEVDVARLSETEGGPITSFAADVRITCAGCGEAFTFRGEPGVSRMGPRVSMDGLELRAPIVPRSGALAPADDWARAAGRQGQLYES